MHQVSNAYKQAMKEQIRDRAYMRVGLGAINLEAQDSCSDANNDYAYWSNNANLFSGQYEDNGVEYATFEENSFILDGSLKWLPREEEKEMCNNVYVTTENCLDDLKIEFDKAYNIKGITLDFGRYYPTEFKIVLSDDTEFTYTNDNEIFVSTDVYENTEYIIIRPVTMLGGTGRIRLYNALMGVGLTFGNTEIESASFKEFCSEISDEIPSVDFDCAILDEYNHFNIDSRESFINFLEIGQEVKVSIGQTLEDNSVEWLDLATLELSEWNSTRGHFRIKAKDVFASRNSDYTLSDRIYTRTAYAEAQQILQDMGFTADQYSIEPYLATITLNNPLTGNHKECLQTLCNACRCCFYQGYDGKIYIRANFGLVVEPEDIQISATHESTWSNADTVKIGATQQYADYSQDSFILDGSLHFLPNDDIGTLDTGYVTDVLADDNGDFEENDYPTLSMQFEAGYTYYGINIVFDGNPPPSMNVKTYSGNDLVEEITFTDLVADNYISYEFQLFDKVEFIFPKGYPNNRIVLNKIAFGDFNDFNLTLNDMYDTPYGTREQTIKELSVKICTYENDAHDKPKLVEDEVYVTETLNTFGTSLVVINPLIHTQEMAEYVLEWLKNYYLSNVSYQIDYRGDARLNASDIIKMESDVANNLMIAVTSHSLKYNGALKGQIEARKALRNMEVNINA
jgi:hypothetical protein